MSPQEFEQYCFLRLYSVDLDTAAKAIPILRRYRRNDVRFALLRDIAVIYSRPFSVNRGKLIKKHVLSLKHVPSSLRPLHDRLLKLRNTQFAHTDLDFNSPKVMRLGTEGRPIYAMSLKSVDYAQLLTHDSDISRLINAVAASVNAAIEAHQTRL
ncbi:MAG: hypothetical protein EON58_19980 [Alphaproteobacteria bacterium]|nr:MAG: hypothetical protein EON58_19980 [Alphaproteobacteria bacterium]